MNWFRKLFGLKENTQDEGAFDGFESRGFISRKHGFNVEEAEIVPRKLGLMDIRVKLASGGEEIFRINDLVAVVDGGKIDRGVWAIVTRPNIECTYYNGEATVGMIVDLWKKAPLEEWDIKDIEEKNREWDLTCEVTTKWQLENFNLLCERMRKYHFHISDKSKIFKRVTKGEISKLVLLLDQRQTGWDSQDDLGKLEEAVREFMPHKIRTIAEQSKRIRVIKQRKVDNEVNLEKVRLRNNLTEFPFKKIIIEIKDRGKMELRALKPLLTTGEITPETLVRYKEGDDWKELSEFAGDWIRTKITLAQKQYLESLLRQNGLKKEIDYDMDRAVASEMISALINKEKVDDL
jgi:hypothetical protein